MENLDMYQDAYDIGSGKIIIDTYAEATRHVDQGPSILFSRYRHDPRYYQQGADLCLGRKGIKSL